MTKIEFFIERRGTRYALTDAQGRPHLAETFASQADAADAAIRFAQGSGALYALYY